MDLMLAFRTIVFIASLAWLIYCLVWGYGKYLKYGFKFVPTIGTALLVLNIGISAYFVYRLSSLIG